MGGMGGDMGIGEGFAMARGGQILMGPLGHLAHYINGGALPTYRACTPDSQGKIQPVTRCRHRPGAEHRRSR
jgi:hypothetical protein